METIERACEAITRYKARNRRSAEAVAMHPLTFAACELEAWARREAGGDTRFPIRMSTIRGLPIIQDRNISEGEIKVGTIEELDAAVLGRLEEWRKKYMPGR